MLIPTIPTISFIFRHETLQLITILLLALPSLPDKGPAFDPDETYWYKKGVLGNPIERPGGQEGQQGPVQQVMVSGALLVKPVVS